MSDTIQRLIRTAFWVAAAFALVMASLPKPPLLPGDPPDKIQHIMAFVVLAALASAGYSRTPVWRLAVGLSCFGALIEIIQAIPMLHRDSSLLDWIADTVAVGVVLAAVALWRSRAEARGQVLP